MKLICAVFGHSPIPYAGRVRGRHVAGDVCKRCRRVLTVRAGSRAERRRLQLGRVRTA